MLDHLDGQHLTHTCLYNLYQNQQSSYHTRNYNIQPMSKTMIWMLILDCSRRSSNLMVKHRKLTSSTYLFVLLEIISMNGVITLFKTIQIALFKSWIKHFTNDSKLWKMKHAIVKHTTTNHWTCWGELWTFIETSKLFIG
jgi:hypothetical protein